MYTTNFQKPNILIFETKESAHFFIDECTDETRAEYTTLYPELNRLTRDQISLNDEDTQESEVERWLDAESNGAIIITTADNLEYLISWFIDDVDDLCDEGENIFDYTREVTTTF